MGKGGSLGVLKGISLEEDKNITREDNKKSTEEDKKIKRGYCLPESTIRKLQELKLYHYPLNSKLEDIVNEAIIELYNKKTSKEE